MSRGAGGARAGAAAPRLTSRRRAAEELMDTLGELFMHMREHFERAVEPLDLPFPCAKALRLVDPAISMKDLGARIHCDASFVTYIADTLEQRGLVRREIDPTDRRIKNLVLTPVGRDVRDRLMHHLFDDAPGMRNLTVDERESLLDLLCKMAGRSRGGGPAGTCPGS